MRSRFCANATPKPQTGSCANSTGKLESPCLRASAEAAQHVLGRTGQVGRTGSNAFRAHHFSHFTIRLFEKVSYGELLPALTPPAIYMWFAEIPSDVAVRLHSGPRVRCHEAPLISAAVAHHGAARRHSCGAFEIDAVYTGTTTSLAHARACFPSRSLHALQAPQVHADDRRRSDFVVYGTTTTGQTLCFDLRCRCPRSRAHWPTRPRGLTLAGTACRRSPMQSRHYPRGGPQRFAVLTAVIGGRWSDECQQFLRTLAPAPCAALPTHVARVRHPGWARCWWSLFVRRSAASCCQLCAGRVVHATSPVLGAPHVIPLASMASPGASVNRHRRDIVCVL